MVAIEREQTEQGSIEWADPVEARARFDELARRLAGVCGDEFIRRWDAGEYGAIADTADNRQLMHLAMLIPFGRQDR